MEIFHNINDFNFKHQTLVTIGTFDGVHIGHQKIIKKLVAEASLVNKKSVLLTFFPHPRMVLEKDTNIKLINTINERAQYLEQTGLDYLIIHPFSKEFSALTALDFVRDILVKQFNIAKLIIGYDHHFGKNREGSIEQLTMYSKRFNFEVEEIPAQDIDEVSVSSTKIRNAIIAGDIKVANSYLSSKFSLQGKVVDGEKLGNTIGFPTANIHIEEPYKLLPKIGVYLVQTQLNNTVIFGMMNIGFRPTVAGNNQTIEVHYFDFNEDLYGQYLTIEVLQFIRDEQKFSSVDALVVQLKKDEHLSRNIISKLHPFTV